jgi:HK97 family phage portal protein
MALGELFTRSLQYQATNTKTGQTQMFEVFGDNPLAPMWSSGDYRGALGLPGAWRAATLLADLIAGLPWHVYRDRPDGSSEKLPGLPPLLERPNPPDYRATTFASMLLDLIMHGNTVAPYAAYDARGLPTAMVPVAANQVVVQRSHPSDPLYAPGTLIYSVAGQVFTQDEVLHIKGPTRPGSLRGMGVLETHFDTLDLSGELNRQARSVSRNGVPTGKLTVKGPDVKDTDLIAVKAAWLKSQRDRTVAAVTDAVDFEPLAWNPEDMQLIEARRFSLHELALIFRVPGWFLGVATDGMTYSNIEGEALNLLKFSVQPWLTRMEEALSATLPPGVYAKANVDALLRSDTKTRYEAHMLGIKAGFLLRSEARVIEDLPPVDGIDDAPEPLPAPDHAAPAAPADPAAQAPAARSVMDLKKYWILGEGRAKWVNEPEPLRALFKHLTKYLPEDRAEWTALSWFEIGMGRPPVRVDGQLPGNGKMPDAAHPGGG